MTTNAAPPDRSRTTPHIPPPRREILCLSRPRYRTDWNSTRAAHAARQAHAAVDVRPASARLRTRIAMIVVAHTATANHGAEDAAKNTTGSAATGSRNRARGRIRLRRNRRGPRERRRIRRRRLRRRGRRGHHLHLRHLVLDLGRFDRQRRRLHGRMLRANDLLTVRRLLGLERELLLA